TQNIGKSKEDAKLPGNKQANPGNQPSSKDQKSAQNRSPSGGNGGATQDKDMDEFFKRNLVDFR
ncbi:MAG: hypothetical protein Q9208_003298, partial [Pyrenodesmia sp. 3 TL-2023]